MSFRIFVLFVCFSVGAGLIARAERPEPVPERMSFRAFPTQLGSWRGVNESPIESSILRILGVDDYLTRAYFAPDRSAVGLFIGYYGSQRQGDTMHSPQNCLPGAGWEPVSRGMLPIAVSVGAVATDPEIVVNRYLIQKGVDRQLVLYWYQSHGRVVASEYWAKFYLVRDAIRLNRTDGALVRVIAPVSESGEAQAERTAVAFVKDLFPALDPFLPG
jgi:EpsI family protein